MSESEAQFEIEVRADPSSVARVRSRLLRWLEHRSVVPARSTGAIALAVSEAVGNATRHAYGEAAGAIRVAARLGGRRLTVVVEDFGAGFGRHADPGGAGLGMTIISRLSDEVSVSSDEAGTRVTIAFELGAGRSAAAGPRSGGTRGHERAHHAQLAS